MVKKRWSHYPTNNGSVLSHFNQTNVERNNCVWTTKYNSLLEMCIVQHVQIKNVFKFQPIKGLVSTTVENAKPAATVWIFYLRTKKWQLCCSTVMVHIALQARRVANAKKKKILQFWKNSPPILMKHTWIWNKKGKNHSFYGIVVLTPRWLIHLRKKSFLLSF